MADPTQPTPVVGDSKAVATSKTILGSAVALIALGQQMWAMPGHTPTPDQMLMGFGLVTAIYGRWVATGPLALKKPSAPSA